LPKTRADSSIRHVTIIDVTTGAEREDQTVRIQGTRTASIATTQEAERRFPRLEEGNGNREFLMATDGRSTAGAEPGATNSWGNCGPTGKKDLDRFALERVLGLEQWN